MIEYSQVESPRWANAEQTQIMVQVNWDVVGRQQWTCLVPEDNEPHIQALMAEILGGQHGEIGDYIPPSQEELDDRAAEDVRATRAAILLYEVDPIVSNPLRWSDMTTEQQNAWSQYRTDLLNITDQEGFPHNVTWPTRP
jgi:hypothetical protein